MFRDTAHLAFGSASMRGVSWHRPSGAKSSVLQLGTSGSSEAAVLLWASRSDGQEQRDESPKDPIHQSIVFFLMRTLALAVIAVVSRYISGEDTT